MGREPVDGPTLEEFQRYLVRRRGGEPMAYILGYVYFYDRRLKITRDVLVPRPETETLLEWAIARARGRERGILALDVGTGSGAIAVALAANAPHVTVTATDIAPEAVQLAIENARAAGVRTRVRAMVADLLPPEPPQFDLVVANLPYVAAGDPDLSPEVRDHEPMEAIISGSDGLRHIRRLLALLPDRLAPGADVGLEIGWRQGSQVAEMARRAFSRARVEVRRDLAGLDRVVTAEGVGPCD
jgi:release factor glutamine methyltransferase